MRLLLPIEFDETNVHEWKNTLSSVVRFVLNQNISRHDMFAAIVNNLDEPFQKFLLDRYDFLKAEKERNRARNAARQISTIKPKPNQPRNDITRVHGYERLAIVSLETVFTNMGKIIKVEGKEIAIRSKRYRCYARSGVKCIRCGIEGKYFAAERSKGCDPSTKYHLNLYHFNTEEGKEIMLTVDHIIPLSRGGEDNIKNLQPLCIHCNGKKGNKLEEELVAEQERLQTQEAKDFFPTSRFIINP
jgi:5-methylcytosine-specific restriction endonuclease McrA